MSEIKKWLTDNKKAKFFILLFFVAGYAIHHTLTYTGHYGYDDMCYAKFSNNVLHGIRYYADHFEFRWAILYLTALSYHIFGINDYASALPALMSSAIILIIVFTIIKKEKKTLITLALTLWFFNPINLLYYNRLMPDVYVTLSVLLSILAVYLFKFKSNERNPAAYAFFFSSSVMLGILSKESIILFFPTIIALFIADMIKKKNVYFWLYSAAFFFLLFILYIFLLKELTSDAMMRFKALYNNSYLNSCSYDQQPLIVLFRRIFYEFFIMIIKSGMAIPFLFIIPAFLTGSYKRLLDTESETGFFVFLSLIMIISGNFMTISVKSYNPMCLDPRHYLFMFPVLSIAAILCFKELNLNRKFWVGALITLIIITILSYLNKNNFTHYIYLPLIIPFSYFVFRRTKMELHNLLFVLFLISIHFVNEFQMYLYAKNLRYSEQIGVIKKYLIEPDRKSYVVSSQVAKNMGEYYQGFDTTKKTRFISFREAGKMDLSGSSIYILYNWYLNYLSSLDDMGLPYYVTHPDSTYETLYQNTDLHTIIYKVPYLRKPEPIILFKQDYEKDNNLYYTHNSSKISNTHAYGGKFSEKSIVFSGSFIIPSDSIMNNDTSNASIEVSLFAFLTDKSDMSVIITIEKDNIIQYKRSFGISEKIHAVAYWWPVRFITDIKNSDLIPGSIVKAYIINASRKTFYIDDFCIAFIKI